MSEKSIPEMVGDIKTAFDEKMQAFDERLNDMAARENRKGLAGDAPRANATLEGKGGSQIHILSKSQKVADVIPSTPDAESFDIADFCKSAMGIGTKSTLTGSTATVPVGVGAQVIDMARSKSRIMQAGSATINIQGPENLARLTADPTVYQHTEGAEDVEESIPGLEAVNLNPKALIALVPLSHCIVEDSSNLNAILQLSIASAIAAKLDSLALATILADTNISTSTSAEDPATWAGVLSAMGSMLDADMDVPSAMIGNSADFTARATQQSASGGWLGAPKVLESMQDLFTSKVDSGVAILGDYASAFAVASRADITLEMLRFAKPKEYSHYLLAHCRLEGFVLQPSKLYVAKATVEEG